MCPFLSMASALNEAIKTMNARVAERACREWASMPSAFDPVEVVAEVSASLIAFLADLLAPYVKTMNLHWHVSGRHFREHHPASR